MSYSVETTTRFDREFKKLDRYTQKMVTSWIERNLVHCDDPRAPRKTLTSDRHGQWRYRIGIYRLICVSEDDKLVILALSIGHRSDIYRRPV